MPTTLAVKVPGGSLQVVDEGDPSHRPILLVHAAIVDSRAWDALVPLLIARDYRVIRYDLRGFGRSTSEDVEFSSRADLIAVLDAVGVRRAAVVGNSAGGQIAIDTAIESPERIAALVTVAAGLSGFSVDVTPEEQAMFDEGDALESADPPDADAIAAHDLRVWVDGPGQPPDRVPSAIREAIRAMDAAAWAPGSPDATPIPMRPPANERLRELAAPVLAIAGALDVLDVAVTARHLEADAPDARGVIWPDVAHMIGMEVPDRLAAAIFEFLAPLPRWS
jgi:3-oxoadipate enol-lactonase